MTRPDPILLSVYRHRFEGIADEMGNTLRRTAFSPNIKERLDFSCALFDAEGRMVAQAAHIPVHLGAMPASVRCVLDSVDGWTPGDIILLNDPYAGGTHLPDLTMVSPVFTGGSEIPVFFVASRAHHSDIGGMSPGSLPLSSELYQEGLILPPVRLSAGGEINRDLLTVLLRNVRTPIEREGDLAAQRSAHIVGENRLDSLIDVFGAGEVTAYASYLQDYSESRIRSTIKTWPNGTYGFEDVIHVSVDGVPEAQTIRVVSVVEDDSVTLDFEGTSPAGPHPFNAVQAITESACYYVVRCLTTDDIPVNDGCFRPIIVAAPKGTIVNSSPPAAVAAGNVETSQRIVDVILGSLAGALPDRVPGASQGTMNNVTMGPASQSDSRYAYYETIGGGSGASLDSDGLSGAHVHMTNTMNTPIEALEHTYPLRVRQYGLRNRSGGSGANRGGDGVVREYEFLEDTSVTVLSSRRNSEPWGGNGGQPGKRGRNTRILTGGTEEELGGQFSEIFRPGERLRIETPGGGGYGKAGSDLTEAATQGQIRFGTDRGGYGRADSDRS